MVAVLRKSLMATFCSAVLLIMAGNALAVVRSAKTPTTVKKKVVSTITVTGPVVKCHQWGFMQVALKVVKTEITGAGKPQVSIKITNVSWPVWPTHTPRSIYINQQALPLLQQETMQLQASAATKLINIAGATHTTVSWRASMQAAIAKALTP